MEGILLGASVECILVSISMEDIVLDVGVEGILPGVRLGDVVSQRRKGYACVTVGLGLELRAMEFAENFYDGSILASSIGSL